MAKIKFYGGPMDGAEFLASTVPQEWNAPLRATASGQRQVAIYKLDSLSLETDVATYVYDETKVLTRRT